MSASAAAVATCPILRIVFHCAPDGSPVDSQSQVARLASLDSSNAFEPERECGKIASTAETAATDVSWLAHRVGSQCVFSQQVWGRQRWCFMAQTTVTR